MGIDGIMADGMYVLAEVVRRECGKAVEFEKILASGSGELVGRLAAEYGDMDVIVVPPFGSQDVPPHEVAGFYRRYYLME